MDKLKYIKFEESQGQYTNSIPIGVDSKNVDLKNGYNLEETLGDYDNSKGTIEERFDNIIINVDKTLTKEGAAADAQTTGTLIRELQNKMFIAYSTENEMIADIDLQEGMIVFIYSTHEIFVINNEIPDDNNYVELSNHLYAHRTVSENAPSGEKYIQNNDYAISEIGDTALSYIHYTDASNDTSSMFFYDTSGLYNNWGTKPTETVNGKHGITCSPFVMDMLFGVKYKDSAYIDGENILNPALFNDKGLINYFYPPRIGAYHIAEYAIKNGYAFFPASDLSNIRAGDVIFTTIEGTENKLFGIGHCEIVGYWINNNKFLVWHSGSVPRTNIRTISSYGDQIVLCARFPYSNSYKELTNLVKHGEADQPHTVTNTWIVADYNLNETLEPDKYYTAIFKMTSVNDIKNQYPSIRLKDGTVLSETYSNATKKPLNDIYCIPFYSNESADSIRLGMSRASSDITYNTVTVDWMVVVKGIITEPINYIPPKVETLYNSKELISSGEFQTLTLTAGEAYPAFGGCYYYKTGTRVHVHIGISEIEASTNVRIGNLPVYFRPKTDVVAIGNGSGLASNAKLTIGSSGSIRIRSEDTYAMIDIEFDAFS